MSDKQAVPLRAGYGHACVAVGRDLVPAAFAVRRRTALVLQDAPHVPQPLHEALAVPSGRPPPYLIGSTEIASASS
jgi:hypothetical protein